MARVTLPLLGSAGVIKDLPSHELPPSALSDVQNIRMRDGAAERIAGDRTIFSAPNATPYHVQLYASTSGLHLVHAGTSAVYAETPSGRVDITGTAPTGSADDRWTGGVLGGVLVLNNGVNKPFYWGGNTATDLATLTNWNANWTCKVMRPFRQYLIALDVTKTGVRYPHMVKWSAAAEPGSLPAWDETDPSLDAGEIDLAETGDAMVDAMQLGDTLIVYKAASMYALTFIGGQYIFSVRRLPMDYGMMSRGCGAVIPSGHVVLTAGDLILHNGTEARSLLSGRLRRWLFDSIDATYYARSFVVANPQNNEVWICFPTSGNSVCTRALIWNWKDDTFSVRDLNSATCACAGPFEYEESNPWSSDSDSWESDTTVWRNSNIALSQASFIIGTSEPNLLLADLNADFHGTAHPARIERTGLSFDEPERVKVCRSIIPRIDGKTGSTVYIQAGGANDVEGSYTWSEPVPYVIGTSYKADLFASGRFLAYRLYSVDAFAWRVRSLDMDVVVRGKF